MILGLVGTNPAFLISDHDVTAASWASDRALVAEVELVFGSVAQVFQLPIVPFPEHPPVNRMVDYDHLRGYLHSDSLGWS